MAAELPEPGVEVIQEFRTVSPTIITPTLLPSIVGVSKQIIDLLVSDGAGGSELNTDALVTLHGGFIAKAAVGTPAVYSGMDTKVLALSVNNGPTTTTTFSGATITPAGVIEQINAQFATDGVTAMLAELVGDTQFQVRTVGIGEFQFIDVMSTTDTEVADAFEIGIGKRYAGLSTYNQYIVDVPEISFPDPRGNLSELNIESASIRAWLGLGNGGFQEAARDTAFLLNGEVNDSAALTGSVDIHSTTNAGFYGAGSLDGTTLIIAVDGGANQTVTFATPADETQVPVQINAQTTGLVASLSSPTLPSLLILTSDTGGNDSSILVDAASTAEVILGLATTLTVGVSITAEDDGDGDSITSIIDFAGVNFTTTPTAAVVTGTGVGPAGQDSILRLSDGHQVQNIAIPSGTTVANMLAIINDVVGTTRGGRITASESTSFLRLTHSLDGTDSYIEILEGTTADLLTDLGLSIGITRATAPSLPEPGDDLWIDGAFVGEIAEIAPGGLADRLKVSANLTISVDIGRYFYIIANNLPASAPRPEGNLIVSAEGSLQVKHEQLRDTEGNPVSNLASLYVSYSAVRLDVTAIAEQRGLLRFDDTTQLEEALSPINTENPLALGLYFALLNSPSIQVSGLGVDAVSADAPFGTVEAFTRAAEYLEAFEVYAIAPLTHDQTVHQVFGVHATAMSEPETKGERVAIVNPDIPTRSLDTLVASGADGETSGISGTQFDTKVTNLTALVLNEGINPAGTIPTDDGLFLDIESDAKNYSITSISGSVVTIRTTFAAGENDDSFYSTTDLNDSPLPSQLIDETFSIKVRGDALTVAGITDLTATAAAMASTGQSYSSRRLWMTVPDQAAATIEGSEQLIEGFYVNAAIAGMVGQNPPQQSFTNFPIAGFTRIIGSNDTFNKSQMNQMAAGGSWIVVQESEGAALFSRMALTTDMTSIETRTDSITKVVDYTAKFLRAGLRNFIGRFNINQGFLDSLGSVIQGLCGLLVETGVLVGFHLNNIIQDEDAPDTVLIDITLDVPYPCNYIRLTLVI